MIRPFRSAIALALLALVALAAGAGVAKAAAELGHACCPSAAPAEAGGDDAPCNGFLPLSCCDAAAIPISAHEATAPVAAALPVSILAAPIDSDRASLRTHVALTPRAAPPRLSVILQV